MLGLGTGRRDVGLSGSEGDWRQFTARGADPTGLTGQEKSLLGGRIGQMIDPLPDALAHLETPDDVLEAIRQMRIAALYPHRDDLERWIVAAKELLERLPPGPGWQAATGYIDGMIALYNRRFGDEKPTLQPPTVPFADA